MSEIWDKPITDTTDWGGDSSTGGLPVSGRQVQAWLKSRIAKILTEAQITKIIKDWVRENGFADDEGFVTLSSDQEINGLKNFLQGLMVNGGLVKYDPELKVWQLTGNLLVTGGISMYSNLEGFTPSTIMDGILTDEVTITVKDGRLTVLAAESGLNYDELDAYLKKYEYTTISEVDARISELVNGAPQAYDTLKEIADVLEGNVNSIGDILATLAEKANTTYVDEAIADTKTWVEEQQYINEIDPSYIEAALGYQPYDGDTNRKEFTTKTYVKDNFVSRTLANEIEAIHNFLNGFNLAGIPFRKMANGSLFIDASVVFSGGATMYGTDTTPAPSIFDGLPIDGETIYWDGDVLKAMGGGGGGGVADSVAWANVTGKPKWLQDAGNAKPTYNYSEIQGTPDLSVYFLASNFTKANIKSTLGISDWALASGKPTYTASEVGALGVNNTAADANKLGGYLPTTYMRASGQYTDSLNDLTSLGIYRMSGTITDGPSGAGGYGNLMVIRSNSWDTLSQLYFNANNNRVFVRSGSTSNLTSKGWNTLALTSDIPSLAGYATESWVNTALAGYLPLSGGMIYGNGSDLLGINRIDGNPAIVFYYNNTTMGRLGFDTSGDAVAQVGGEYKKILHSGNYSNYALAKDGTAASATKLATPRTIWGQSFDGTGNVSGDAIIDGTAYTQKFRAIANSSTNPTLGAMGSADFGMVVASGTTSTYGLYGWITGSGDSHLQTGREDGNTTPYNLILQELGGNVAIGGTTASEKLHVHGNVQITGNLIFDTERQTLISRKLNSTGETAIFTQVNSDDNLLIGQGIAKAGKNTYIYGKELFFAYGTAGSTSSTAMHIYSNGDVAMARTCLYPQTQALNASSGVLRFYSIRDTISGPSIQGVHAQMGYGAKHLVFYQHNTGGYTEYEAMRLTYDGNLVIGGTTANAKLHVYGNLLTEGGITMYSQRSLKNILSYEGLSLEQLSVIKPIKFTWKDGRDNRYHVGGVADDVETVVPEVVYSTNDFLTMDYGNAGFYVAASLIKPVIDHEQRIEQLENRVKELENENKQLRQSA